MPRPKEYPDNAEHLFDQLAEAHKTIAELTDRVHELVVERGRLYDERRILKALLDASELREQLGILSDDVSDN